MRMAVVDSTSYSFKVGWAGRERGAHNEWWWTLADLIGQVDIVDKHEYL